MADFQFLKNPVFHNWVISAPRRAKRPDVANGSEPVCPFCPGKEANDPDVYRVGGEPGDDKWQIRVVNNKFPFAPQHEVIIHSPDHHANFGELPISQVELILQTYKQRYQTHEKKGEVFIFHNRGEVAGESLPHPHTQLAVVPFNVKMDIPRLDPFVSSGFAPRPQTPASIGQAGVDQAEMVDTDSLYLFCPKTSQWPDEVWVAPKNRGRAFGEVTEDEIKELAYTLTQLVNIFNLRHGQEFPFNFYIYPGGDWYLRIIPRLKRLGGFEIGTNIYVNTQDPVETLHFIKEHFHHPDEERIKKESRAEYHRSV